MDIYDLMFWMDETHKEILRKWVRIQKGEICFSELTPFEIGFLQGCGKITEKLAIQLLDETTV